MKTSIFLGTFLLCIGLHGGTWTTAQLSTPTSAHDVIIVNGPGAGELIAAWDSNTFPFYSLYSGGVWSAGVQFPIGLSSGVFDDIFMASGPSAGEIVAIWTDRDTAVPFYTYFSAGNWSVALPLVLTTSTGAAFDTYVTAGPNSGQVVASWSDAITNVPYYAINTGGVWGADLAIPLGASSGAHFNVFIAIGPGSGEMMAIWSNTSMSSPFPVYYSLFNGVSWSTGAIPLGSSLGPDLYPFIVAGPNSGEMLATWIDTGSGLPYYSLYSGGVWSTAALISPSGPASVILNGIFTAPGPSVGQIMAVWVENLTNVGFFSIFSGGSWSAPAEVTNSSVLDEIFIAPGPNSSQMIAAWSDTVSGNPFYSIFNSLLSPIGGSGIKIADLFPFEVQWYNSLSWTPVSLAASYNVSRNGLLIASGIQTTNYVDYDRPKNGTDVYTITSVDADGNQSTTPLQIIVH